MATGGGVEWNVAAGAAIGPSGVLLKSIFAKNDWLSANWNHFGTQDGPQMSQETTKSDTKVDKSSKRKGPHSYPQKRCSCATGLRLQKSSQKLLTLSTNYGRLLHRSPA
jgi:hypothetical protein